MFAVVMSMMLTAAPLLAMPGLNAVNVGRSEADLYGELLAQRLQRGGLKVLSARDLSAVMGLERQKQLLGCAESSCVAELAGALGTDGLLVGDVGKLETLWALNVKVLSATGEVLAQYSARIPNADAMPDALEVAGRALLTQLAVSMHHPELQPPVAVASPLRSLAPVPLIIGGTALVAGAACLTVSGVKYSALQNAQTVHLADVYRDQGKIWQPVGLTLVGVGAAGLITGAIFLLVGAPQQVTPTVAVFNDGASLGIAGVLP